MSCEIVRPWEVDGWDGYVSSRSDATVYHTSAWCRIVSEIGGYESLSLLHRTGERIDGVLPVMEVRSLLTGNRMNALPFSDECAPLGDDAGIVRALIEKALVVCKERGLRFFELRGDFSGANLEGLGFGRSNHFSTYAIPLKSDPALIRKTFSKKAVRQTINKSARLGVTVRRGEGESDMDTFYRLYVLNRKHHGIPPQPRRLFSMLFERMTENPEAVLYLAEHEGRPAAGLVVFRFNGVVYAKYEGIDGAFRDVLPIHGLLWRSIEDAARAGDRTYDFGRTAADNEGLNAFKSRWGTERRELPYLFHPPGESLSVVGSGSLKYRLFTGVFKRMPPSLAVRVGERIFRHFG